MAVRTETRLALELVGLHFMPPLEGVAHLLGELRAGAPEGEVLILDRAGLVDLDGILPSEEDEAAYRQWHDATATCALVDGVRELRPLARLVAALRRQLGL
jgi:hypothetical protein